jgi:hypothetical protein
MRQFLRVVLLLVLLITAAAQRRGFAPMPRPALPPAPSLPITTPPIATPPAATFGAWRRPEGPRSPSGQPAVVVVPYATPYPVYVESQAPPPEEDDPQQYQGPSPPLPATLPPPPAVPPTTGCPRGSYCRASTLRGWAESASLPDNAAGSKGRPAIFLYRAE